MLCFYKWVPKNEIKNNNIKYNTSSAKFILFFCCFFGNAFPKSYFGKELIFLILILLSKKTFLQKKGVFTV